MLHKLLALFVFATSALVALSQESWRPPYWVCGFQGVFVETCVYKKGTPTHTAIESEIYKSLSPSGVPWYTPDGHPQPRPKPNQKLPFSIPLYSDNEEINGKLTMNVQGESGTLEFTWQSSTNTTTWTEDEVGSEEHQFGCQTHLKKTAQCSAEDPVMNRTIGLNCYWDCPTYCYPPFCADGCHSCRSV